MRCGPFQTFLVLLPVGLRRGPEPNSGSRFRAIFRGNATPPPAPGRGSKALLHQIFFKKENLIKRKPEAGSKEINLKAARPEGRSALWNEGWGGGGGWFTRGPQLVSSTTGESRPLISQVLESSSASKADEDFTKTQAHTQLGN